MISTKKKIIKNNVRTTMIPAGVSSSFSLAVSYSPTATAIIEVTPALIPSK